MIMITVADTAVVVVVVVVAVIVVGSMTCRL